MLYKSIFSVRAEMEGPAFISLLLDPTEKRSGLMDTADEAPEGEETTARIRPEYHEGSIFRDPIRALLDTWRRHAPNTHDFSVSVFLKIHCALQ